MEIDAAEGWLSDGFAAPIQDSYPNLDRPNPDRMYFHRAAVVYQRVMAAGLPTFPETLYDVESYWMWRWMEMSNVYEGPIASISEDMFEGFWAVRAENEANEASTEVDTLELEFSADMLDTCQPKPHYIARELNDVSGTRLRVS